MSSYGTDGPTATPPGWYPTQSGQTRYWDGQRWTDHVAPPSPPQATSSYAVPSYAVQRHQTPYPAPYGSATPATVIVAPKNPGLALIASFFIPGLGQFINGDGAKGAMFLIAYLVSWGFSLILIGIPFLFGTWIWSMIDAWTGAKNWNLARGIIS